MAGCKSWFFRACFALGRPGFFHLDGEQVQANITLGVNRDLIAIMEVPDLCRFTVFHEFRTVRQVHTHGVSTLHLNFDELTVRSLEDALKGGNSLRKLQKGEGEKERDEKGHSSSS